MTNSLVLGTESFFCDHTGVVHFDPGQGSTNRKNGPTFFPNRGQTELSVDPTVRGPSLEIPDPAYQETKFRLLEPSASSVMAVSYNYLTGTLAYADIDGKKEFFTARCQ